jgi:hypothetical protein
MSAQHAPPDPAAWVDDRDTDPTDHDPHGIVPDGFVQAWGGTSIPDALRRAEAAPSSTPTLDRGVCPACESQQVSPKAGTYDSDQRQSGAYKCLECGAHFDSPADAADAPGEQATLPGVRER